MEQVFGVSDLLKLVVADLHLVSTTIMLRPHRLEEHLDTIDRISGGPAMAKRSPREMFCDPVPLVDHGTDQWRIRFFLSRPTGPQPARTFGWLAVVSIAGLAIRSVPDENLDGSKDILLDLLATAAAHAAHAPLLRRWRADRAFSCMKYRTPHPRERQMFAAYHAAYHTIL